MKIESFDLLEKIHSLEEEALEKKDVTKYFEELIIQKSKGNSQS